MEKKTKHTPGEWLINYSHHDKKYDVSVHNENENSCEIICETEGGREQDKANALLIAASPDMLQGLQGIIKSWEVLSEGNYTPKQINDWLANDMKPEIDKAREIIKKATGDE